MQTVQIVLPVMAAMLCTFVSELEGATLRDQNASNGDVALLLEETEDGKENETLREKRDFFNPDGTLLKSFQGGFGMKPLLEPEWQTRSILPEAIAAASDIDYVDTTNVNTDTGANKPNFWQIVKSYGRIPLKFAQYLYKVYKALFGRGYTSSQV